MANPDQALGALLAAPSFWTPERLVASAWHEHAPFAFWLVAAHRPGVAVELGVHHGFAYLALCQAVQRLGLSTRCYGVDSWAGDDHAGHYGPEVLAGLEAWHNPRYGAFSALIPSTFDAALAHIEDGTIDLLHIDGRHGYGDVRHDFETWRPKLSPRAVVLLHDINVRREDFGVDRFWADMRSQHKAFEFPHGHGLGVLGIGTELAPPLLALFEAAPEVVPEVQRAYARLGAGISAQYGAEKTIRLAETLERMRAEADAASRREQGERASEADRVRRLRAELVAAKSEAGRALIAGAQQKAELEASRGAAAAAAQGRWEAEHTLLSVTAELESERFATMAQRQDAVMQYLDATAQREQAAALKDQLAVAEAAVAREQEVARAAVEAHRRLAADTAGQMAALAAEQDRLAAEAARQADTQRRDRTRLQAEIGAAEAAGMRRVAAVVAERDAWSARSQATEAALFELGAALEAARREVETVHGERARVLASPAWRVTAPLRGVAPALGAGEADYAGVRGRARLQRDARLIAGSQLFDAAWYRQRYGDVATEGLDPAQHYLRHGAREGRDPGPRFSTSGYLGAHPDVAAAGLNPLVHYLRRGAAEGRAYHDPAALAEPPAIPDLPAPPPASGIVAESPPPPAPNAAELALRTFPATRPVPVFTSPGGGTRRVTMVTNSVNEGTLYGGVGTALVLAALLARRLHARLRILTRDELAEPAHIRPLLDTLSLGDSGEIEFVFAPPGDPNRQVETHEGELFLTTSWWTTRAMAQSVGPARLVYLLQEDERMFYPHGDERLRCAEVLADPAIEIVVNSRLLYDHLIATGIDLAGRATWFEPAFPVKFYNMAMAPRDGRRNFFFYARHLGHHSRNLYLRGVEALAAAIEDERLDPTGWAIHFVGGGGAVRLPRDAQPILVPPMPWTEYAALVRSMDAGLALIDTPHPSYPPLDLAASGAVVVTNSYGTKRSLAQYCDNILIAEPDPASLARAIGQATRLAADWPARRQNYEAARINRSWDIALKPVLDRLASR